MPDFVVLGFGHLEFLHLHLGVPRRHVGVPDAAAVLGAEDVANPQVDGADPPARRGGVRHLGRAAFGDRALIQILSSYYPKGVPAGSLDCLVVGLACASRARRIDGARCLGIVGVTSRPFLAWKTGRTRTRRWTRAGVALPQSGAAWS